MRIAVIHGNDGSDVRVGKTCRSLSRMGHEVFFIGWDRCPNFKKSIDLGQSSMDILNLPTKHGRWNLSGQFHFLRHIVSRLRSIRPDTVCCVNEDLTFFILPLRKIFCKYLVCDVYDALFDRHSHRCWLFRMPLWIISTVARAGADRLIATDPARLERFGRYRKKGIVIENVPDDPGEELSKILPTDRIKIYVTGSLSSFRGLENLIEVVEKLDNVEIIATGWPYYDYAKNVFVKHPKVSYKGVVTLKQSLELAAQCDAVLAFYSPFSINERNASPNKINDAMSVGRPVIITSETAVSRWVKENDVGLLCEYDNTEKLRELILSLDDRRKDLPSFAKRVRKIYLQGHTWELMEQRLKKLYDEISDKQ